MQLLLCFRGFLRRFALIASALPLVAGLALASGEVRAAPPAGVIAYLPRTTGASDSSEIHLIQPDGTNDRRIYQAPTSQSNQTPLNDLAWSPDATRLAFHSRQENACSIWESDIYTIYPDGSGLTRLTNPPKCADLASYPQGSVSVTIANDNPGEGFYLVYIQGAPDMKSVTVPSGSSTVVTFDKVADFGPGVTQLVGVTDGPSRWIPGTGVDVLAGGSVDAGVAQITTNGGHRDVRAMAPTWRSDGQALAYAFVAGESIFWIPVTMSPGDWAKSVGTPVFPPVSSDLSEGLTADIAWSPAASNADQFLYVKKNIYDGTYGIWLTTVGSNSAGQEVVDAGTSQVVWLNWLPDGSGFVFSVADTVQQTGAIYVHDLSTKQSTPVLTLANEYISELSVSPDGQSIVFDRTAVLGDPNTEIDVWIVQRDGAGAHKLVANAFDPVWSLAAPTTPSPSATPTATATPPAEATPTSTPLPGATATPTATPTSGERARTLLPDVMIGFSS